MFSSGLIHYTITSSISIQVHRTKLTMKELIALMLLLRFPSGTTIPLSSFYSYGYAATDTLLPQTDDGSSPAITLPTPFLFYGINYSTIYVNNNGDLSFGLAWTGIGPTPFPITTYPVVAIYQADVDTRGTGRVWYRTTRNATLLAKAANDIHSLTGTSVSLQWLFIATWDHVGYYSYGTDKTNTFQAILVTSNARSYALLQYADGLIQWPSSGAQVGFNAGNNLNYVNIPGSRTPYILNITGNSNVGVRGQWVFSINQAVPFCGVLYNYDERTLARSGFVKCYDQPYSSTTTTYSLDACSDTQIVFAGTKSSTSSTMFAIGAFGSPYVFTARYSTATAYYDIGGAYWYRYPFYSFGFTNSSSINLNTCDYGQYINDCGSRLCWHLDQNAGGYRAGCTVDLNSDTTWRKVIYKGNNGSAMCSNLRPISSSHASAWLSVTPSPRLNLHLEPAEFQVALKWWFGILAAQGECCPHCPLIALDEFGHHALSYFCQCACLGPRLEMGCGAGYTNSQSFPADILVPKWDIGKPAASGLSVMFMLHLSVFLEASMTAGSAALGLRIESLAD
ncbi:hypothetical protein EMCRGX_G004208 [Ephydatia muelleri]